MLILPTHQEILQKIPVNWPLFAFLWNITSKNAILLCIITYTNPVNFNIWMLVTASATSLCVALTTGHCSKKKSRPLVQTKHSSWAANYFDSPAKKRGPLLAMHFPAMTRGSDRVHKTIWCTVPRLHQSLLQITCYAIWSKSTAPQLKGEENCLETVWDMGCPAVLIKGIWEREEERGREGKRGEPRC